MKDHHERGYTERTTCAVCNQCWKQPGFDGRCVYGGPFSGYLIASQKEDKRPLVLDLHPDLKAFLNRRHEDHSVAPMPAPVPQPPLPVPPPAPVPEPEPPAESDRPPLLNQSNDMETLDADTGPDMPVREM